VLCCADCNCCKGERPAGDFLRGLYREGRLTVVELRERLKALEDLSLGKLRPVLETSGIPRREIRGESQNETVGTVATSDA